jgi:hypothetical protein
MARTVVDLARELPLREAMVTIDQALAVPTLGAAIQEVLDRQHRWPGVRRARTAVSFGDPRSESALESIARVLFADAGIPPPVLQAQFWAGRRWMPERVDFWWPQFRTVAEADGLAKYDAPTPAERRQLVRRDLDREHRLAERNLEIVRFGWEDAIESPGRLADRMRQAFGRGLRRTGEPPVWREVDRLDLLPWALPADPDNHLAS